MSENATPTVEPRTCARCGNPVGPGCYKIGRAPVCDGCYERHIRDLTALDDGGMPAVQQRIKRRREVEDESQDGIFFLHGMSHYEWHGDKP